MAAELGDDCVDHRRTRVGVVDRAWKARRAARRQRGSPRRSRRRHRRRGDSSRATVAPSAASNSLIPRPIPRPPPVTSATRPSSLTHEDAPLCNAHGGDANLASMQEGSRKAIIAAFFANLGIAVAKFIGFLITRSAGLLAESAHSLADTGNQALLMLGSKPRQRDPPTAPIRSATDPSVTSGRSSSLSCCSAWADCSRSTKGIDKLRHPHEVDNVGRRLRDPAASLSPSRRTRCARRSRSPTTSAQRG